MVVLISIEPSGGCGALVHVGSHEAFHWDVVPLVITALVTTK